MRRSQGLTLAEVLIALTIMALGVLAAADMQISALSMSGRAAISQQLTKRARAELELQRQLLTPKDQTTCLSENLAGYTCMTAVLPCSLSGSLFVCAPGATPAVAYRVSVATRGPRAQSFTLSTLIAAPASR